MNWFLTTVVAHGRALRRARLLVQFGLSFGVYCACFVPILFYVSAPEAAIGTAVTSTGMILSPFLLRWGRSIALASSVLVASIALLFTITGATLGGLSAPTTPCLVIAPIVALFLLGPRAGIYLSVVAVAAAGTFYGFDLAGSPLPLLVEPRAVDFLKMAGVLTVVAVSLVFLLQYDRQQNSALRAMSSANMRMVEMVSHLEATSATLRESAAEFDTNYAPIMFDSSYGQIPGWQGDDLTSPVGLTHQMLMATRSGRSMIGAVSESIRGMIDQYDLISQRIRELHQQSGIIAEMVSTIDSISNRLDMMALSTGIEAAHAGPSGRSFERLAADMRRLAEQVLDETSRIKTVIGKVQHHTAAALKASQIGQILTEEGSAKLELMARAFDEIYQLVEQTATASRQITGDTVTQLAVIHDLVQASLQAGDETSRPNPTLDASID